MDSEQRASELASHISNPAVRKRVRENLARTLQLVEQIKSYEDEDRKENSYKTDQWDRVPVVTRASTKQSRKARIAVLRETHAGLFEPEEQDGAFIEAATKNVNVQGKWGYTPLHFAVVKRDVAAVQHLLELGADPTITDNSGKTALDKAVSRGYDEITELFRKIKSN